MTTEFHAFFVFICDYLFVQGLLFHKNPHGQPNENETWCESIDNMVNLKNYNSSQKLFDNKYRLIEKIGGGGFSEVWLAHNMVADMDVALKIYTPSGALDEDGREDFKREFAHLCGLNHSNIIHAIDFGIHENELPYLAMTVCKNGSAKNLIGNASEDVLWDFIEQVASGLQYLHEHNITHQDIKPDNILINSDGQYLIIDFGISTKTRNTLRRTQNGNIGGGTPWYMSKESFGKEGSDIHARDIWAFGASLYEIMTGETPFGQYGGITQKSNGGKVPIIKQNYSDALKQLVYDCLALESWDRPDAETIVKRAKGIVPPPPPPYKKMLIMFLSIIVLVMGCYYIYPLVKNVTYEVADFNKNDSIFLAKIVESSNTVKQEVAYITKQTEYDKIVLNTLIGALDSFNDIETVMLDSISTSAKKEGELLKMEIENSVDSVCSYLEYKGNAKIEAYGEYGGRDARDRYYRLRDSIRAHFENINN